MTDAPCRGCTHRHAGCHADCEQYKDWCVLHKAETDAAKDARCSERTADSYAINMVHRIKKEKRRRRR